MRELNSLNPAGERNVHAVVDDEERAGVEREVENSGTLTTVQESLAIEAARIARDVELHVVLAGGQIESLKRALGPVRLGL